MRSNYSREERQKIVEEYIQSGKSQTVFAPEYGNKPNTLSAWVTKYKVRVQVLLPSIFTDTFFCCLIINIFFSTNLCYRYT
ncbi:MAG: transposase [Treponema sp.]|nr:transposase [Treponema sp.]